MNHGSLLKSTVSPLPVIVPELSYGQAMPHSNRCIGSTEIIHPGSSSILPLSFLNLQHLRFCSIFLPNKKQITLGLQTPAILPIVAFLHCIFYHQH